MTKLAVYTKLIFTSMDKHVGLGLFCFETEKRLFSLFLYLLCMLPKMNFEELELASDVLVQIAPTLNPPLNVEGGVRFVSLGIVAVAAL